jgi:maleate isomerase
METVQPCAYYEGHDTFVGMITPSGNTVVERITLGIMRHFPRVSTHFSRTPVFGKKDSFPNDYDWEGMLGAAQLLAHAKLSVITWNGSKGASVGMNLDRKLVERVTELTGAKSTTSMLAIDEVFREDAVKTYALVSPYSEDYAKQIVTTLASEGYQCIESISANLKDNMSFSLIPLEMVADMMREAAKAKPQAILSCCTNFPGATVVGEMERELGLPIYDTTSMAVWKTLVLADVDTAAGSDWGSIFLR